MDNPYFDLTDSLMVDTILAVKYHNKWCTYNIPKMMANGVPRTYGYIYYFYFKKDGFRMAKGYIRGEENDKWYWTHQYLYFDKFNPPKFDERVLPNKFYMGKAFVKSARL